MVRLLGCALVWVFFMTEPVPARVQSANCVREFTSRLDTQRQALAEELEAARVQLLKRAQAQERQDLVDRLEEDEVVARKSGYGRLPQINQVAPGTPDAPRRRVYDPSRLEPWLNFSHSQATTLRQDAVAPSPERLASQVELWETRHDDFENLEEHLDYHQYWQPAVLEYDTFFEKQRGFLLRADELLGRDASQAGSVSAASREQLIADIAPFSPGSGQWIRWHCKGEPQGPCRHLEVTLHTDIEDREYVQQVESSILSVYNEAPAAKRTGFKLSLKWIYLDPDELYPDGRPSAEEPLDEASHLKRFPEGALVLTTGAKSTHAFAGRSVHLGSASTSQQTLAHEFAHLLGFDDAYIRGYEPLDGEAAPCGVVLVEWWGLQTDLMGDSDNGSVTESMLNTLFAAWREEQSEEP